MKCLNIGCGCRYNSSWVNIDINPVDKDVIGYDINKRIPFTDNSFDVVYHSHLIEHIPKKRAESFIKDCVRIVRPGGIMRVVVPDLEQIARMYLKSLEQAVSGSEGWAANYEWMMLEMYDQAVRNQPGGDMAAFLAKEHIPNKDFIIARIGVEARNFMETGSNTRPRDGRFLKKIYRVLRFGRDYMPVKIGRFRLSGEVHQWMYDRYSLSVLLEKCGMTDIIQRSATESYLQDWVKWNLDTETDGTIYKPDSLYMEGKKPT